MAACLFAAVSAISVFSSRLIFQSSDFQVCLFPGLLISGPAADRTIPLELGARPLLALEKPFKNVLIGDPDIVDVHTSDDRSVILEPNHQPHFRR
jgi:Flp pilus assembly secretin CpaC